MLRKSLFLIALSFAAVFAGDSNVSIRAPQPSYPTLTISSKDPPKTSTSTTSTVPPSSTKSTNETSTTSTPPSTTSPTTEPPSTIAPPTKGHYVILENGNETCLMADFAAQIYVDIKNVTWEFDVPVNASLNGSICNNVTQELHLSWEEKDDTINLIFQFAKNETTNRFMVSQITLSIPNQSVNLTLTSYESEFSTPLDKSYRCEKQQEIQLSDNLTNSTYAILKISRVQLQAFHSSNGKFAAAEDCDGSSSPDVVPIAVGCALVLLIAIVLIAYLVGRRRSQARGYLSM